MHKYIENEGKPNEWQNTVKFDQGDEEQQQIEFNELNDKKQESKKENEEKIIQLKLQLEIESFIDKLKNNNWIINFDIMEQINHWWTHNVFDPNKSGNFIVKINKTVYNESLKGNENRQLNENSRKMANDFINDRNKKFDALYKSFWIENCLYERFKLVKIQYQGNVIECPIVIQEKSDLYWKGPIDFPAKYIESISDEDKTSYEQLNNKLLTNQSNIDQKIDLTQQDDALMYKNNTKLQNFINDIMKNENLDLKNKVEEFLERIKDHYENTWEIIDLVGENNVIFYQEWEKRNFKIWSVIKATWENEVNYTLNLLWSDNQDILRQGIQESQKEKEYNKEARKAINNLNNILAYTRILNYLWIKLGKGKIININLSEKQIKNLNELWV